MKNHGYVMPGSTMQGTWRRPSTGGAILDFKSGPVVKDTVVYIRLSVKPPRFAAAAASASKNIYLLYSDKW